MSCTAIDKEDGTLSGNSIIWQSDKVGILGTGNALKSSDFLAELTIGTQNITIIATDAAGSSSTYTFKITITNNKPIVKIIQPANTTYEYGQLITFEADISDVEDANIIGDRISWKSSKDGQFYKAALKFGYDKLSVGSHEITLSYTDGHGETVIAKTNLSIGIKKPEVIFHPVWWSWVNGNSLKFQGRIADTGGGEIIDKGFVISTDATITIPSILVNEGKILKGPGSADFEVQFDNLKPDQLYYVRAYATNGKEDYSDDVRQVRTENTLTVSAPSKVVAGWFPEKQGNGIYWQDNSNDETGFVIEISEDSKSAFVKLTEAPANTTFYSYTFGAQHYYSVRVAAKKSEIMSDWAEVVIVPKSTVDLTATTVSGGIKLNWFDQMNHNASKVSIRRGTTSGNLAGLAPIDPGIGSYTDNNAAAGQNYYYDVFSQYASTGGNVSRSRPTATVGPVQYNTNPVVTNPTVTTDAASGVTTTSAVLNGTVTSDGGASIVQRGYYVSKTSSDPSISDNVYLATGTTGAMTYSLSGLTPNTPYFFKAWAKNSQGLHGYGNPVSFKTNAEGATGNPNLVWITVQGGTFQMGSNDGESDEKPVHLVTLSSFKISKYEITHAQFIQFLNDIKCKSNGRFVDSQFGDVLYIALSSIKYDGNKFYFTGDNQTSDINCPVIHATWYGANAFCKWAGVRLPTEAEWEFAARGGIASKGYTYAGSNTLNDVAWHYGNSGGKTHPVGQKASNELGLYDMSGNAWEICSDWYGNYNSSNQTNPFGPTTGAYKVRRGGSWNTGSWKPADRWYREIYEVGYDISFRVAGDL